MSTATPQPKENMGQPEPRLDARAKVTGAARYGADQPVVNPAFAWLVTSSIARGRITAIDSSAAAAVPVKTYQCPSVPQRSEVTSAIAKFPRPAMTFANPIAPSDYEAIQGVQPSWINPHLPVAIYSFGNRFSILSRNSRTRITDVTDGTTSTILVVECAARPLVFMNCRANGAICNDQGIG